MARFDWLSRKKKAIVGGHPEAGGPSTDPKRNTRRTGTGRKPGTRAHAPDRATGRWAATDAARHHHISVLSDLFCTKVGKTAPAGTGNGQNAPHTSRTWASRKTWSLHDPHGTGGGILDPPADALHGSLVMPYQVPTLTHGFHISRGWQSAGSNSGGSETRTWTGATPFHLPSLLGISGR